MRPAKKTGGEKESQPPAQTKAPQPTELSEEQIIENALEALGKTQKYEDDFFGKIQVQTAIPMSRRNQSFGVRRRSYAKARKPTQRVRKERRSVKKKYCPKEMTKKSCNPKSDKAKDPAYECNPKTGRWMLRKKKSQKKASPNKAMVPSPSKKIAKAPCNPKLEKAKDPAYECNPKTGRWVLRKKRSQKKASPIKALVPSPARSLLTPVKEIPKMSSRRRSKRKSRGVCQDKDPITGERVDDIEDVVKIKTNTGDWICFDRKALIDSMANGPIWFTNKTMSDNMQDFIEFFISFGHGKGDVKLRNKVIYDLYNKGKSGHIGFYMAHTKNAPIVREFLNKLFTTYRLMEWPLDKKILLSGTSIKYLKDPSITEFHMVKAEYIADEPHTFFGKGKKSSIYMIAPLNINKLGATSVEQSFNRLIKKGHVPQPIIVADYDDVDDIFNEIDTLPEAEYGKGRMYNIGDIARECGIVY